MCLISLAKSILVNSCRNHWTYIFTPLSFYAEDAANNRHVTLIFVHIDIVVELEFFLEVVGESEKGEVVVILLESFSEESVLWGVLRLLMWGQNGQH